MAQVEPMDIDSEFDNKENSLHHSNVLSRTPCTEKGYEELDVSELNMKLRYSITPASSPMSKSLTASSLDNRTFDSEDYISNVVINENCNLTRSLNSTITRNDVAKLPKSLPLQVLSSESITDNRNTSVLRSLDKAPEDQDNNVTITLNGQNYLDDNMSLPSTSSTPEANTPTKEVPKHDGGSPIMRGLKSVLNMFRSSQSPIQPAEVDSTLKQEILSPKEPILIEDGSKSHLGMASTPISNKQREVSSSQRSSPLKESIVFNDDLERELQWKDETTILFKGEKIPIHKLLLPQSLSCISKTGEANSVSNYVEKGNLNSTVEHMDISYNDSFSDIIAEKPTQPANITNTNDQFIIESDGEFVDCETTINNDDVNNKILENLTASISSQNITLHQSHLLQMHTGQQLIVSNQSETPNKDYSQINCDKSEISIQHKDDCINQEIQADFVIKNHGVTSNTVGTVQDECQNEVVSKVIKENSAEHKLRQFDKAELKNNNNAHNNISSDIIHGETTDKNINIGETLASQHPSDIPLPDEDDIENVLNYDQVISTVKQEELNLKLDQQKDMSIIYNSPSIIEHNSSQSENKETNKLDSDCIHINEIAVKDINEKYNQEIVLVNANTDEIIISQQTDEKENVQIINTNDNFTLKIDCATQEVPLGVTVVDEELNLETNAKTKMDSLDTQNKNQKEEVTIENKTKYDINIDQGKNSIIGIQDSDPCVITENTNDIAADEKSEQDGTYILEKNNLEELDNINCNNYLGSDNSVSFINNDGKDIGLTENFHVNESEVSSESKFENIPISILAMMDNMDAASKSSSNTNTLPQQDNKSFEINVDHTQKIQDVETILQSKCTSIHDDVLDEKTVSDVEITSNQIENIESIAKEMLDIDSNIKVENIITKEGEETIMEDINQTTKEEDCADISIENEFALHISQTNEIYNKSVVQNDIFEDKGTDEKPYKNDHDAITLLTNYEHFNIENETVQNNILNNEMVCNFEHVNQVTSNETFNMSIGQEDGIENKIIKGSECGHDTNAVNTQDLDSERLDNISKVIPDVILECAFNQQSITVSSCELQDDNRICQKEGGEEKKCEETIYESHQKIDTINISQQHEILDTNNDMEATNCDLNSQNLIVSSSKTEGEGDSNTASHLTLNMSIDQDISEIKETKGNSNEYPNLLHICPQENQTHPIISVTKECILNPQNLNINNSNNGDLRISNETFDTSIDKEDIGGNKEIKENVDKSELEVIGECAINKQNVTITHSELNDAKCNTTYITDDNKEGNHLIVQTTTDQTHTESENITEAVFLPEQKPPPSANMSVENNAIDQRNYSENTSQPPNPNCEIKNDQVKQEAKSKNKSIEPLILSSENINDKVETENCDEKLEENIEPGDCSRIEMKSQNSPPLSPVISSKGYNFNFDEIDDPFATKTKIRTSPPLEDCPSSNENGKIITKANINKKDFQRRKSMPVKRQPPSLKSKINSTFSEAIDYEEIKQNTKMTEKIETEIAIVKSVCDNSQVSENHSSTTLETNSVQTEEMDKYIGELTKNGNVHKSDEPFNQIEMLHEGEIRSNQGNSNVLLVDKCEAKNVFNLPEMSADMNFSPFATKSRVCRTPSPELGASASNFKVPANFNEPASQSVNPDGNITSDVASLCVGNKADHDSSIASSSSKETENATVREVNTEDEDTVEGPFFEADDLNDDEKMSEFVADSDDMMNFNDILPRVPEDNCDNGEMFIDAEAFEFLLNQNKSNMVVDSGKESLFLKFDPLFAKRMSSDGVLAALNKVQKRQSTPKRVSKAPTIDFTCDKMSTGTLNLNATTEVNSVLENNFEDPNTTVSKPMMVVNPAVNSIISPRNKPIATPPRANRRSLTFTSPAIAVIDRLLSLSGNNSMINAETPTRQVRREPNETDLALTQLRELLAEKEIHVHNLRLESKDLKERLSTLETQVKSLESESEQRLRKVNDLNGRLVEKTNINRSMAAVVEEYERTIASLIAETEQDKKKHAEERLRLVNERDEQTAHLASMEISFNDLHSKYEKSKQIILACKSNEDTYRRSIKEFEESLLKMQNNYELLKQHATSKLNQANQELERLNRAHEAEVVKLNAMIKRKDLHITSLEETLAQKTKANEELTAICDELINKVG